MSYNSIMVDLETMATTNNAAIISIGAFKFDLYTPQRVEDILPEQKFYTRIDLASSQKYGLFIDAKTVQWWLKQEDAARNELQHGVDLRESLKLLMKFMEGDYMLWGNGSTFDNIILRNAFEAVDLWYPIKYKNDLCYRTANKLLGGWRTQVGVKHNALDDAISQALHLQQLVQRIPKDGNQ